MLTEAGGRPSTTAVVVPHAAVTSSDYSRIRRLLATTSGVQILLMVVPYLHLICGSQDLFRPMHTYQCSFFFCTFNSVIFSAIAVILSLQCFLYVIMVILCCINILVSPQLCSCFHAGHIVCVTFCVNCCFLVQVPVSKFQELRYNVALILKEMNNLEKRSILQIQD